MDPYKENWKKIFDLNRREKRGIFVLLVLTVIIAALPDLYNRLFFGKEEIPPEISERIIRLENTSGKSGSENPKPEYIVSLFHFNPNKISGDSLQLLGFTKSLSSRIVKYRSSGGIFRSKEDLKKIYGMPDSIYMVLEPFIVIPEIKKVKTREKFISKATYLDINTADSAALLDVRGIGPVFASRIIRYRDALGGFVNSAQLMEVYGISDSLAIELKKSFYIEDGFVPATIELNSASAESMRKHPYLRNYRLANAIVEYRNQHGRYNSPEDLLKIHILSQEDLKRLSPYLSFE